MAGYLDALSCDPSPHPAGSRDDAGSACIYSKKVEYLYKLVYETLDSLANKK